MLHKQLDPRTMSRQPTFALAGATGGLGPVVLKELLANRFRVTLLTRKGSSSAGGVERSELLHVSEIDYSDVNAIRLSSRHQCRRQDHR